MLILIEDTWNSCIALRQGIFRARKIIRNKEKHYIIIKPSVLQEETQMTLENMLNERRELYNHICMLLRV